MSQLKNAIKAVASILALLPGVAILFEKIQMPPDVRAVFGSLMLAVGFIIIILAIFAGAKLEQMRLRTAAIICVIGIAIFVATFVTYSSLYNTLVVKMSYVGSSAETTREDQVVLPLQLSSDLAKKLTDYAGDWRALLVAFPTVRNEIDRHNGSTEALLFGLLLISYSSLVFTMVLAAWRVGPVLRK